jgi:hypothetical protein
MVVSRGRRALINQGHSSHTGGGRQSGCDMLTMTLARSGRRASLARTLQLR